MRQVNQSHRQNLVTLLPPLFFFKGGLVDFVIDIFYILIYMCNVIIFLFFLDHVIPFLGIIYLAIVIILFIISYEKNKIIMCVSFFSFSIFPFLFLH